MDIKAAEQILLEAQNETTQEQRSHLPEIEAGFFEFMKTNPSKAKFCRHMTRVVVTTGMFYYAITGALE